MQNVTLCSFLKNKHRVEKQSCFCPHTSFRHQATAVFIYLFISHLISAWPVGRRYNYRSRKKRKKKKGGRFVSDWPPIRTVEFAGNDMSAGSQRLYQPLILLHQRWHFNLPAVKPTVSLARRWQIIYCVRSPSFIPGHLPLLHGKTCKWKTQRLLACFCVETLIIYVQTAFSGDLAIPYTVAISTKKPFVCC